MKKTVAVIYGGRSAEHEVSLVSGKSIAKNLDKQKFEVKEIKIEKNGDWISDRKKITVETALENIDIAFPVLHGTYGEDGKIQGLFEMFNLPFVGCGVTESALGMDKEFSKTIWYSWGLPVVKFQTIHKKDWQSINSDIKATQIDLIKNLKLPIFVKPACLGSSVGITKVKNTIGIEDAVNLAFEFGDKVIVEESIEKAREIEVSVIGNSDIEASICGEIKPKKEFYDYEAKYEDEETELFIPARIDQKLASQIRHTAINAYEQLGLYGLSRVDFLLSQTTGKFYISEVNTMPGFTPISMFPKLWESSGLSYTNLITKLVNLGFDKYNEKLSYKV